MTMTLATALVSGALAVAATTLGGHGAANAEMSTSAKTCSHLRQDYAAGVAKNRKAANRVVTKGYRRPIVCKRLYLQVRAALDLNGNRVACETR